MGQEGDVLTVEFTVMGMPCIGLNGGQASQRGWCKDRWGVSWQITLRALIAAIWAPCPSNTVRNKLNYLFQDNFG